MKDGQVLGPYRIVRALGAGGMGEVYLAEDSRLGRQVAIKVLPAQFAADPERLARFDQEARRAAAALNHPNIAVVHDVGRETDDEGSTTHFLVQELLDGEDLHAALQAGPLTRERALRLGAEIAEALAAAHAAGIVHRDLKPQNVFVSPSGHAKVLDFGLAKLVESPMAAGSASPDATESPTMLGTMAGVVMGSAGYMAPEQASGGEVDHRADLFAAGCVLYEMLVGHRAFQGDTLIDTLHAVTRSEPDALAAEDSTLEPDLRWLLQKCLAKDPASRYQSAGDLAVDLRRLASSPGPSASGGSVAAAPAGTRRWLPWIVAPIALVVGAAIGMSESEPADGQSGLRMSIAAELPPDFAPSYFAISPDGSTVAFRDGSTESSLIVRRLDSFEGVPVLNSAGALGPRFSPDGSRLSFFASGRLWVVDVAGGTPRALADVSQTNSSSAWSDDGFIYFSQWATGTGIWRVPDTGGVPEEVLAVQAQTETNWHKRPRLLPDGRGISVDVGAGGRGATQVIFFDGSPSIQIDREQVMYLEDGRALFVDAGRLSLADYDRETYEIVGTQTPLESGVAQYELSATGTLFFRHLDSADAVLGQAQFVRYSRSGRGEPLGAVGAPNQRPAVSPDGSMIGAGQRNGIYVWDLARGTVRPVLDQGLYFQWAPDNNTVYFQGNDGDEYFIGSLTLDGSAPHTRLVSRVNSIWPTDVSADGRLLAYYEIDPQNERDIWFLPLDGSGEPQPYLATPASERSAVFSPDGRWVAYMSEISGREEVYVRPTDNPSGGEVLITVNGGREPRWAPDGSEIYFRLEDGLWAVPVSAEPRFTAGAPELLLTGRFVYEEGGRNQQYDILGPDEFLMVEVPDSNEELRVAIDWLSQIRGGSR